jgi:hypothetical protein
MTQDAPNKNTSDITWSKVFSDTSGGPEQVAEKAVVASEPVRGISDTITGDYSSLDDLHQRQDASTSGNSIGSGAYKVSGGGFVNVYGDADLLALGQSRVYSRGQAKVAASQGAMIFATDQVKVTASGNAAVCAMGAAKVYAGDEVIVVALDRTEVYRW